MIQISQYFYSPNNPQQVSLGIVKSGYHMLGKARLGYRESHDKLGK